MTLNPICEKAETIFGVPLTVTGVAQVKIMRNPKFLQNAAEQFIGKSTEEIQEKVLQTLEGHLRAILGTLTVEDIYQDRVKFAQEVILKIQNLFRSKKIGILTNKRIPFIIFFFFGAHNSTLDSGCKKCIALHIVLLF